MSVPNNTVALPPSTGSLPRTFLSLTSWRLQELTEQGVGGQLSQSPYLQMRELGLMV